MFGFGRARRRYFDEVETLLGRVLSAFPDEIKVPARATIDVDGMKRHHYRSKTAAGDSAVMIGSEIIGSIIDRMSNDFRKECREAIHENHIGQPFHTCLCTAYDEARKITDDTYVKLLFAFVSGRFEGYPRDVIYTNWQSQLVNDFQKSLMSGATTK